MDRKRWQDVGRVYVAALEQPPEFRAAFVAQACGEDAQLRGEVESLLAQDEVRAFVDEGVDAVAADVFASAHTLSAGQLVGPYRIVGLLGAGGMGEVYRAHDTKLQRDVAIKILPDAFVHDPDRLARFTREAHVLASLNHPNIAAIYGIEDAGEVRALVLELVDGPTLADRIAQGPLPIDEALGIARQIATALQAAHDVGVIHRDLKPANIKVREDGTVKVLDFGLAKASGPAEGGAYARDAGEGPRPDQDAVARLAALTQSPTIMSPAMTAIGVILGTAAYMSPEQAKGKPADRRSDIWAFGCVLYEMLTGKRAFDGEDVSDTLAAILRGQPDWTAVPSTVPAPVVALMTDCLERDRGKRIADISTVLYVLRRTDMYRADPARTQEKRFAWLPWAVAAGLALASVALMMVATQNRVATTVSLPVTRFEIRFPQDHDLYRAGGGEITLAPDGRSVFYIGMSTSGFALYRRPLDQLNSVVIPGSEARALSHPTPSPDGLSLVYYKEGQLTRIAATGGTPRSLTTLPGNFGVTWADERTVVFNERGRRLWQIPAAGGMPTALTGASRADAVTYRYPAMLPGGSVVAYTRWSGTLQSAKVAIRSMRSGEERVLFDGSNPRLTPSGHLLFARGDGIWAVGINSETLQAVGEPVRVLENVTVNSGGLALFGISASGTLAYVPGSVGSQRTLVWVDRNGRENTLEIPSGAYSHPRISPDGRQVVVTRVAADGNEDIWLIDASTAQMRRVTSDPASDVAPVWTPDGRALVFGSSRGGGWGMWRQAVEGPEGAERIPGAPVGLPLGFAADGALLVQESRSDGISRVIAVGGTTGAGQRVLAERKGMTNGALSPDGLWLAYQSNQSGETGQSEIYLVEMSTNQQWKVSADGGEEPAWSSDGRELFYRALDVSATSTIAGGLMSVRVQTAPSVTVSAASQVLGPRYFRGGGERLARYLGPITGERQYDVSRDGQRFLMLKQPVGGTIVVVQNWFEELKQRVPVR